MLVCWRGEGGGVWLWKELIWEGKFQQTEDETWSHGEACPAHCNGRRNQDLKGTRSQVWVRRPGLSCPSTVSLPWAGYRGRKLDIKSFLGLDHDDVSGPIMYGDEKALFCKLCYVISPWGCKNQAKMKIIHFSEWKITHLDKYLTKLTCPLGIYSNQPGQSKHLLQAWRRERQQKEWGVPRHPAGKIRASAFYKAHRGRTDGHVFLNKRVIWSS